MKNILAIFTLVLIAATAFGQECETEFDFNNWSAQGTPDSDWFMESSNNVINTNYIFPPTFFVNNQNLINVLIKGTMSVETGEDDDFFGIVFGYHQPTVIADHNHFNFYLFDWKATTGYTPYGAFEGFRLSSYNGFIRAENQGRYFWGAENSPPIRRLLKTKYGNTLGWIPMQKYEIELLYTSSHIRIKIDDVIIFDLEGCFSAGKFGFYCMSQTLTRFKNFTYQSFIDFTPSSESVCINDTINFNSFNLECSPLPDFIEAMNWDFGDGQTSTEINPEHYYSQAGEYPVELIVLKTDDCHDTIIKTITVKPNPIVDLGNDTLAEACTTIKLDAGNEGSIYLWSTGEVTQHIEIGILNTDTTAWVIVDKDGCLATDSILIKAEPVQTQLFFPNAFSPNNDGKNDLFIPIGATEDILFYSLAIFNRWGQLMFETNNPLDGWDGKYLGQQSPHGVYTYKVSYQMGKFCSEIKDYSEMKTITLVN